MLGARAHNLLFIHQLPRGGMKNERLKNREMCDERKSEKRAFSEKKTELEGRVMWEPQMRKGGKHYPVKQAPCARLSVVSFCFISILVLSRFECYSMCLGCVPFISLLSRFAVFSRRLNTWSKTHLSISKIKSFCAPSAVPFSTSVQNKIRSFIKPQGSTQVMSEQQN